MDVKVEQKTGEMVDKVCQKNTEILQSSALYTIQLITVLNSSPLWQNTTGLFPGQDETEGLWIGDIRYKWSKGSVLKTRHKTNESPSVLTLLICQNNDSQEETERVFPGKAN